MILDIRLECFGTRYGIGIIAEHIGCIVRLDDTFLIGFGKVATFRKDRHKIMVNITAFQPHRAHGLPPAIPKMTV